MNSCVFAGRIGKDPTLVGSNASPTLVFSIAVDGYERGEKTVQWVDVALFGKAATALTLAKGQFVVCSGRVSLNHYVGKDGAEHYSLRLAANNITPGGGSSGARREPTVEHRRRAPTPPPPQEDSEDDIPF